DVVRYGNPVTISGGRVYCATSMGVVACCDARDGLIVWMRTYSQDRTPLGRRQGAAPLVAGRAVVYVPRDAAGLFALDSVTGDMLWQHKDEPAYRALGTFGK